MLQRPRDFAPEPGIAGAVDFAHSTGTQHRYDFAGTDPSTSG
jgi:hypothetical protein